MTRFDISVKSVALSRKFFRLTVLTVFSLLVSTPAGLLWSAESSDKACTVLADKRVEEPVGALSDRPRPSAPFDDTTPVVEAGTSHQGALDDLDAGLALQVFQLDAHLLALPLRRGPQRSGRAQQSLGRRRRPQALRPRHGPAQQDPRHDARHVATSSWPARGGSAGDPGSP